MVVGVGRRRQIRGAGILRMFGVPCWLAGYKERENREGHETKTQRSRNGDITVELGEVHVYVFVEMEIWKGEEEVAISVSGPHCLSCFSCCSSTHLQGVCVFVSALGGVLMGQQ